MGNYPYYADFLLRLKNHLFPTLIYQGVDFYRWYYSTYEPHEPLYLKTDCVDLVNELETLLPASNPLDALAEWIRRQHISDASAVLDAIEMDIEEAEQKPLSFPAGLKASAVEAVSSSLLRLIDRMP